MKEYKFIVGCLLMLFALVAIIGSVVASVVFHIQNPNMTAMRRMIEFPQPSIACVIALIVFWIGGKIATSDTERRNKK